MRAALRQWVGQAGSKRIVASGHSLGAALATLFASDHGEAELVTIGSPRVGTRAFAQTFGERTVRRYVDCCDVVTTVPPAWIWFSHTQGEIYIDHAGKVRQPPIGAFDRLADQAAAKLEYVQLALGSWDTVKVRDLADHAPVNYVSAMLGIRQPI
jgi:pimeloyl-ACP methyl ester carboxylesterase